MSARSRLHDPLAETPFWRTRGFASGMLILAVMLAAGATIWLVKVNQRQQMQWRLEEDPKLSRLKLSLTNQIAAAKDGQARAPVALWLGKVKEFTVSQQTNGSAAVSLLKLEEASLLAGTRAKGDSGETLSISGKHYTFGGPQPRPGETWMVAVWRDSDGNNVIQTAVRAQIPGAAAAR